VETPLRAATIVLGDGAGEKLPTEREKPSRPGAAVPDKKGKFVGMVDNNGH
jgi:hypothetical protein